MKARQANKSPAKPASKSPAKPASKSPAKPASKSPAKPASKSPAKPASKSPAGQSTASILSDLPGLETIPEEPSRVMPNKYLYTPLIETHTLYVHPDDRITSEVMTDFEYNHVIGVRAQQLANELKSFTEIGDLSDPIEIAKLEIANKRCPLSIRRVRTSLPDRDIAELWDVNDMSHV